jgi:hypothetical protein
VDDGRESWCFAQRFQQNRQGGIMLHIPWIYLNLRSQISGASKALS